MRIPVVALTVFVSVGCKRPPETPRPTSRDVHTAPVAAPTPDVVAPVVSQDAGPPPVAIIRMRNVSEVPITITTNPDPNEMLHVWRVNVSDDRSDRAAMFVHDPALLTRVKLFPVDLPRCDSAVTAGFGGLGETRRVVVAPGETFDVGSWDGMLREEVVDPQRGACLREVAPPPGRYRLAFDQPKQTRPDCQRVMVRVPVVGDGGVPVIELRCVPRADAAAGGDEDE
jgi:hypothetical protein